MEYVELLRKTVLLVGRILLILGLFALLLTLARYMNTRRTPPSDGQDGDISPVTYSQYRTPEPSYEVLQTARPVKITPVPSPSISPGLSPSLPISAISDNETDIEETPRPEGTLSPWEMAAATDAITTRIPVVTPQVERKGSLPTNMTFADSYHLGDAAVEILRIKQEMQKQGYFTDNANLNNKFTQFMEDKVRLFQEDHHLPATGVVDQVTLYAIFDAPLPEGIVKGGGADITASAPEPPAITAAPSVRDVPASPPAVIAKKGDSNDVVLSIKEQLLAKGYFRTGTQLNRKYSDLVAERVRQFQMDEGLPETGEVDQKTYDRLFDLDGGRTETPEPPEELPGNEPQESTPEETAAPSEPVPGTQDGEAEESVPQEQAARAPGKDEPVRLEDGTLAPAFSISETYPIRGRYAEEPAPSPNAETTTDIQEAFAFDQGNGEQTSPISEMPETEGYFTPGTRDPEETLPVQSTLYPQTSVKPEETGAVGRDAATVSRLPEETAALAQGNTLSTWTAADPAGAGNIPAFTPASGISTATGISPTGLETPYTTPFLPVTDAPDAKSAAHTAAAQATPAQFPHGTNSPEEKQITDLKSVLSTDIPRVPAEGYQVGNVAPEILEIKQRMQDLGYFPQNTDLTQRYHPQMRSAVEAFQMANHLTPSGILDQVTVDTLYSTDETTELTISEMLASRSATVNPDGSPRPEPDSTSTVPSVTVSPETTAGTIAKTDAAVSSVSFQKVQPRLPVQVPDAAEKTEPDAEEPEDSREEPETSVEMPEPDGKTLEALQETPVIPLREGGFKEGDRGPEVLAVKQRMQELGFFSEGVKLSEIYNDFMTERVMKMQKESGLKPTGVIDDETWAFLYSSSPRTETAVSSSSGESGMSPMGIGSRGEDVLRVKKMLQKLGYFSEGATLSDQYNDIMAERVNRFQKEEGLPETGRLEETDLMRLISLTDAPANSLTDDGEMPEKSVQEPKEDVSSRNSPAPERNTTATRQDSVASMPEQETGSSTRKQEPGTRISVSASADAFDIPEGGFKVGSSYPQLMPVKKALMNLGYFGTTQSFTNSYSEALRRAVAAYQKDEGLEVTHEVDAQTVEHLLGLSVEIQTSLTMYSVNPEQTLTIAGADEIRVPESGFRKGRKYPQLVVIKKMMQSLGYFSQNAELSGMITDSLPRRISKFQSDAGLPVTGEADKDTVEALIRLSGLQTGSGQSVNVTLEADTKVRMDTVLAVPASGLCRGDHGLDVIQIKLRLEQLGYPGSRSLSPDFDMVLVSSLVRFQKANGLEATGVLDPETATLLFSDSAKTFE